MPLPRLYTTPNTTRRAATRLVMRRCVPGKVPKTRGIPILEFQDGAFDCICQKSNSRALKQLRSVPRRQLLDLGREFFLRILIQPRRRRRPSFH